MRKAVVLLSGGIDSATTLAIAMAEGFETYALTFDYGQRHKREIEAAKKIASGMGVKEHKILSLDMDKIGGSALTDTSIGVPSDRDIGGSDIPVTYVPARNLILLGFAVAWAEVLGADVVFIGANAIDYSGYPDCREEFFEAFRTAVKLGTRKGVEGWGIEIRHPLLQFSKADIIKKGLELNVPFEITWSCYQGGEKACGKCDSCRLRLKGFQEAGAKDPIEYE
jgi:7-cyano-7-deazaguanine synthase